MLQNRKVYTLENLLKLREAARAEGKVVVHCHGCFDIVHPGHVAHLQFAKSSGDVLLQRARGMRVLVVGDYVLDRYHFCDATDVAGESPMLSLRSLQQRDYDGGAGVIALHLAALGAQPALVGALADDDLSNQIEMR